MIRIVCKKFLFFGITLAVAALFRSQGTMFLEGSIECYTLKLPSDTFMTLLHSGHRYF